MVKLLPCCGVFEPCRLRDKKIEEAFQIISRVGFGYADILAYSKDAHLSREMDQEERQKVVKLAEKYGIKICKRDETI